MDWRTFSQIILLIFVGIIAMFFVYTTVSSIISGYFKAKTRFINEIQNLDDWNEGGRA